MSADFEYIQVVFATAQWLIACVFLCLAVPAVGWFVRLFTRRED